MPVLKRLLIYVVTFFSLILPGCSDNSQDVEVEKGESNHSTNITTSSTQEDPSYTSGCNWDVLALRAKKELIQNISLLQPCVDKMIDGRNTICWMDIDRESMVSDFSAIGEFIGCLSTDEIGFEKWKQDDNELLIDEIMTYMKRDSKLFKQGNSLYSESIY